MTIKQSLSSSVLDAVFAKSQRTRSPPFGAGIEPDVDPAKTYATHRDILLEPLFSQQEINVGEYPESPIDFIRQLVDEDDFPSANRGSDQPRDAKPIFVEMLGLHSYPGESALQTDYVWSEFARWIKYEESVEEGGKRFSKPHVTMLTLPCLLQLRNCFRRGVVLLDLDVNDFSELIDTVMDVWEARKKIDSAEVSAIRRILLCPKHHLVRSQFRDISGGRPMPGIDEETNGTGGTGKLDGSAKRKEKKGDVKFVNFDVNGEMTEEAPLTGELTKEDKAEPTGEHGSGKAPGSAGGGSSIRKKIADNSEAACLLVGQLDEQTTISTPLVAFVRLAQPCLLTDMPEVSMKTKFVFLLLVPLDHSQREINLVGKALGTLLIDKVFSSIAYRARSTTDFCHGIDEFLSQIVVVPAGNWSTSLRWEPSEQARLITRKPGSGPPENRRLSVMPAFEASHGTGTVPVELQRTGRCFGGLVEDFKRKAPFYLSDFADGFRASSITQILAGSIFLFFANITKIITFGGVMESMLDSNMAAMENLLSGGICGVLYALFSGQPLCVLSATGPTLVFEFILFRFCKEQLWDYLPMRFWVGAWTALIIMLLIAFDASVMVAWITKFTEEAFATLISVIFIIQAFEEVFHIIKEAPLTTDPQAVIDDPCFCNNTETSHYVNLSMVESCKAANGTVSVTGLQCSFLPDVFLFSLLLFIGTFTIAYGLKHFRNSGFFPTRVRSLLGDFNVLISVVIMTSLNILIGLQVPKLKVPQQFAPTKARSWIVDPFSVNHWWIGLAAVIPALLFSILVVMDQQITSVIINRKENKLKKGYGYYLDLLVIALLMLVCATLGIPFYVAATVISIMHVDSLKMNSECAAPGDKPQFLGVREQRITAVIAHVLIGLAVLLTPVIRLVPLPVLLGIFLYMGVVSLSGQEFVQRIMIMFMPVKYQPDYRFLRLVPLRRVHLFTFIQLLGLILLFAVKYTKRISMMFPLMLIVMMLLRKLLDNFFSQKELLALDDPLPSFKSLWKPHRPSLYPAVPLLSIPPSGPEKPIFSQGTSSPIKKNSEVIFEKDSTVRRSVSSNLPRLNDLVVEKKEDGSYDVKTESNNEESTIFV